MRLGVGEMGAREERVEHVLASLLVDVDGLLLAGSGVCTRR